MSSGAFIRMGTDAKWEICPEGAALLESVQSPMKVIAVAGLYRTGKSFFLNMLAGTVGTASAKGFGVGATSESCTRGIDIYVSGSLVLLDTEGLASMEQDESYDAQIFSLALLLSSYFVLNSMGVIDEAAIDRLYLIAELSKHICVSSGAPEEEGEAQLSSFFPPFTWLLRDFVVDLSSGGERIDERAYMEKALELRPDSASARAV